MAQTLMEQHSYEELICGQCGVSFWVPYNLYRELRQKGQAKTFYCPNGHGRAFTESESDNLRRQLEAERRLRDEAESNAARLERKLKSSERILKRTKTRVRQGVCPCCTRSFQNLRRHMATKHPDYEQKDLA